MKAAIFSLVVLASVCGCASAQGTRTVLNAAVPPPPVVEPVLVASLSPASLLITAESAANSGDTTRALELMERIPANTLTRAESLRLLVLRAQVSLMQGDPEAVLRSLPAAAQAPELGARIERFRAQALADLGDGIGAVQALNERVRYLNDTFEISRNHEAIWQVLQTCVLDAADLNRAAAFGPGVSGWAELAALAREPVSGAVLEDWRRRYPGHPGEERLGLLLQAAQDFAPETEPSTVAPPISADSQGTMALLLPLSGSFAATAEAVRDGFIAAHLASGLGTPLRIYDAGNSNDTTLRAYQQALAEGAGFVVGPLRKESVAAIAALGQPPAPVLALNYMDEGAPAPFNFFQFGLAPEDEARAAAERAVAEGQRRAIALVPQTEWGERVYAAFAQRLRELGGRVLDVQRYAGGTLDFSPPVASLLRIEHSRARNRALTALLGAKSEFEPRRRDDVDFIFFAARPQEARLIWPQFRFHRASDLPAYATSLVHDGNGGDADLNGVRFCDMPWLLETASPLRSQVTELASARAQPRLFAFGADAFALSRALREGSLRYGETLPGVSGALSVQANGTVRRALDCARFEGGAVRPLPPRP